MESKNDRSDHKFPH